MRSKFILEHLTKLWEHMSYYNSMAPFPVYDTEYVEAIRKEIKKMKESKFDYDELPVAACKYCNSLHIEVDDVDNDICMRCGSVNEIEIYKNIKEYNECTQQGEEEA